MAIKDLITLAMSHVNDLSVTARLPSEILSHIFAVLSDCDLPLKSGYQLSERRRLGWNTMTHMCRHWRQAALFTPALWTKVGAPQTGQWMNEMLARSKEAPFTLSAEIAENIGVCKAILKALGADHMWRMKHLCLSDNVSGRRHGHIQQCRIKVLAGLIHPVPMLESLTLKNVIHSDKLLLLDMFAGCLPSLCRFTAQNLYGKGWDASHIRNLTDLELDFQSDAQASLATLLILLKNSSALENLKIVSGEIQTAEERLPERKISLLCLKTLYFSSQANTNCAQFLASLIIPSTAQMSFRFAGRDVEKMLCIIPLITAFIGTKDPSALPSPSWIRLACNRYFGDTQISVSTWLEGDSKIPGKPPFSVHWNFLSPTERVSVVQQLLASFDLCRITHLVFDSTEFDETILDTLEESFSRMPAMRVIGLHGIGSSSLLGLLGTSHIRTPLYPQISDVDGLGTNEGSFIFPNLTRLRIEAPFDGRAMPEDKGGKSFGNLLLCMVQKRSALGARIDTLQLPIEKWSSSKAMLKSLRKHVNILCH